MKLKKTKALRFFIIIMVMATVFAACKTTQEQAKKQQQERPPYHIIYKINIPEEVQFVRQDTTGRAIEVDYRAVGTLGRKVWDITLVNRAKGRESIPIVGSQKVEFPFWGRLSYQSTKGEGDMEFIIYEPGYWQIILTTLTGE